MRVLQRRPLLASIRRFGLSNVSEATLIELKGKEHDRSNHFLRPHISPGKGARKAPQNRPKSKSRLRPRSPKKEQSWRQYEAAKARWREKREKEDGFRCQVSKDGVRCSRRGSCHPHHKAGRVGEKLYAEEYFLCVCANCHRYIHDHPAWAYDQGYLIKRL
jgi:hypothetical protein